MVIITNERPVIKTIMVMIASLEKKALTTDKSTNMDAVHGWQIENVHFKTYLLKFADKIISCCTLQGILWNIWQE